MTENLEEKKEEIKKFKSIPQTLYLDTDQDFAEALGRDFIDSANALTKKNKYFLVGLAHGQSPSYAYDYILKHYEEIVNPELIWFTFTNSRLKRQRDLENIMDSFNFVRALIKKEYVKREHIFGADFDRENLKAFVKNYNKEVTDFLTENKKKGYDYVFLASDPKGKVAGICKSSKAFLSDDIMVVVTDPEDIEPEITVTPSFILKSSKIAYIATKSDKRTSLAWLYSKGPNRNERLSF